ncbi:DUF6950 family protein [Shinella zoogloeoides]|uniref:DUF6950 family protein n=1 Tax=Shinella zoogloeoides TaxID=352475 RepID=UPI001F5A9148|nr:hypothetical protein [Shinella zoogloeoides]
MAELVKPSLKEFVAVNEAKPWAPGYADCCIILADWAIWLGNEDPAKHLRGAYSDEIGYQAIISAAGGVVPLVASCADEISERVEAPEAGAVGVIGSRNNVKRQFGAIHDGCGWLVRTPRGFDRVFASSLAIWRLQCRS